MFIKHHTKGIVISDKTEDNDSRRAVIFTQKFGLINARVQGSRVMSSKLRFSSQDFSSGEFSLIHGKSGWRLVGARAEQNFFEIFRNYPEKLKIVCNILNLIKKLVSEEENKNSHHPIFSIIYNFFNFLTIAKENNIALAECLTLMRILHTLGYMRHDPEFVAPILSTEINARHLETIAPRRSQIIALINESLKLT